MSATKTTFAGRVRLLFWIGSFVLVSPVYLILRRHLSLLSVITRFAASVLLGAMLQHTPLLSGYAYMLYAAYLLAPLHLAWAFIALLLRKQISPPTFMGTRWLRGMANKRGKIDPAYGTEYAVLVLAFIVSAFCFPYHYYLFEQPSNYPFTVFAWQDCYVLPLITIALFTYGSALESKQSTQDAPKAYTLHFPVVSETRPAA